MNRVLVVAVVGLATLAGCGGSRTPTTVASAGDAPESTVTTTAADVTVTTAGTPSSVTTAPAPPASTDTTAPPPKESSTTTTVRPTTTTARPTTTTTRATTTTTSPAGRTVTVTSAAGAYATTVTVRGDGCTGSGYGVTLSIHDPSGQEIPGDGGSAQPDGTWQLQEPFNHSSPAGDYTFAVSCITAASAVVFRYTPATFHWNG